MAILEKIAGWRHFYRETETAILITNEQHQKWCFLRVKRRGFSPLSRIFE